jgi:hypothetical protein
MLRRLWSALTGKAPEKKPVPPVIVHDPAAKAPHDLDDPFLDPHLQQRIGEAIARVTAEKK